MTDREFDLLLQEDLSRLPPAPDVVNAVNPWRKAFRRILWGFALNNITVHFAALQYILPTVGMFLLLLGFRTLRRENGYFRAGWVLTVILGVCRLFTLGVGATVWNGAFAASTLCRVLNHVVFAVTLALLLCLRSGLRTVQRKAGTEVQTRSATALAVWYFLILPLSLLSELGTLLAIPMLIAYVCIIVCLRRLAKVPEDSGYVMEASPVRLSDGRFTGLCCILLALLLAVGWIFFRQYPMEFSPAPETAQEEAIADLSELAIPEHILRDLTDEDLAACMGAERVVICEDPRSFPDGSRLRITTIAVDLPEHQAAWKFIHHYQWEKPPHSRDTEILLLQTVSRNNTIRGWITLEELTGRVLCDRGNVTYASPYFRLSHDAFISDGFWGAQKTVTSPMAIFSFPVFGSNCRFYVAYDAWQSVPGSIAQSWSNYVHQTAVLQYPVVTAQEYLLGGQSYYKRNAFQHLQSDIVFYLMEDDSVSVFRGVLHTRDTAEK